MNVSAELISLVGWMIGCGVATTIGAIVGRRSIAKINKDTSEEQDVGFIINGAIAWIAMAFTLGMVLYCGVRLTGQIADNYFDRPGELAAVRQHHERREHNLREQLSDMRSDLNRLAAFPSPLVCNNHTPSHAVSSLTEKEHAMSMYRCERFVPTEVSLTDAVAWEPDGMVALEALGAVAIRDSAKLLEPASTKLTLSERKFVADAVAAVEALGETVAEISQAAALLAEARE